MVRFSRSAGALDVGAGGNLPDRRLAVVTAGSGSHCAGSSIGHGAAYRTL